MRQYGKELSEEDIQEIMRTGKHDKLPQKYLTIVEECLRAYVDKVYNFLLEHGYNLEVTEIVFVSGGANVVKRFDHYDGNNIQYIEDVKANARDMSIRWYQSLFLLHKMCKCTKNSETRTNFIDIFSVSR